MSSHMWVYGDLELIRRAMDGMSWCQWFPKNEPWCVPFSMNNIQPSTRTPWWKGSLSHHRWKHASTKSCRTLGFQDISVDIGGEGHSCNEGTASRCDFDDNVLPFRSLLGWVCGTAA